MLHNDSMSNIVQADRLIKVDLLLRPCWNSINLHNCCFDKVTLDGASQNNTVQADDLVNKCCSGRDCMVIGIAQAVLGKH